MSRAAPDLGPVAGRAVSLGGLNEQQDEEDQLVADVVPVQRDVGLGDLDLENPGLAMLAGDTALTGPGACMVYEQPLNRLVDQRDSVTIESLIDLNEHFGDAKVDERIHLGTLPLLPQSGDCPVCQYWAKRCMMLPEVTSMLTDRPGPRRVVVDVDSRGRVSLARFGIKDTQLIVEPLEDGGIAMHPAVVMTPAEARHYTNPEAVERLDQALASARSGNIRPIPLRSQST